MGSARDIARDVLDRRLREVADLPTIPPGGWVRTLRESLGMTMRQLAERIEKSPSAVVQIERNEVSGAITLQRLREVADAMDCEVRYVLVPRAGTVRGALERRAEVVAGRLVRNAHVHMALEDQAVDSDELELMVHDLSRELLASPRRLWDKVPG